jgi:hypothetical protein
MAEEVVYRVRFEGASEMASQINGLENRLDHLKSVIQNAFTFTPRISGPKTRIENSFWKRVKNDRGWTALPFLPSFGDAGRDMANAFRTAHKLHDEYAKMFGKGTGDFRGSIIPAYSGLSKIFSGLGMARMFGGGGNGGGFSEGMGRRGFAQRLLGFNGNLSTWGFIRNPNTDAMDAESWWSGGDESARTRRMRRPGATHDYRWEFRNPYWDDPFDFYANRRRRRSWSSRIYSSIESLVPRGAARDIIGRMSSMGPLGKGIGLFIAGILATTAALAIFKRAISLLFAPIKALADDVFRFYRTRHQIGDTAPGRGNGILSNMGWAGYIMGGNPEDNIALVQRIASERASLLWGGDGGKYISAARRFGVDISGSGRGGLATEREWLRNIAIRMMELDPEGKLALANEAGLSREQMWMVSNGVKYFDWASSRRTLSQMAWGDVLGKDIYTENFQQESQNFWTDFGMFMETMKEFFGSIGEILLPIVNTILEILTGIFNLINLFLKPIATLVGKIFSLLNISFWTNMMNMENSMPNYGKYDMGMIRESIHPHANSNIKTGDIYIQSDAANTDDAAKELASKFVNSVGNTNVFEFVVGSNIQGAA